MSVSSGGWRRYAAITDMPDAMLLDTPGAQTAIGRALTANDSDDGVIVIARKRYLALQRLARSLNKSPRTISRWNEQRLGPPRIKIGNLPLFDEEKLPAWPAEYESQPLRRGRRR